MISRRDAIKESERVELSARIAKRLFAMNEYKNAGTVLSYASFRSEVMTDEINKRIISDGKALYLPKTDMAKREMVFYRVRDLDTDLQPGAMDIREPEGGEAWSYASTAQDASDSSDGGAQSRTPGTAASSPILVLVPGVAFDLTGRRMGYGGGFYDRLFAEYPELIDRSIFLAYETQRAENLPSEPTDVRLKSVLTERDFYDIIT